MKSPIVGFEVAGRRRAKPGGQRRDSLREVVRYCGVRLPKRDGMMQRLAAEFESAFGERRFRQFQVKATQFDSILRRIGIAWRIG